MEKGLESESLQEDNLVTSFLFFINIVGQCQLAWFHFVTAKIWRFQEIRSLDKHFSSRELNH